MAINTGNPRDAKSGMNRAKLLVLTKLSGYKTTREKRLALAEIRAGLASQLDACDEIQTELANMDD